MAFGSDGPGFKPPFVPLFFSYLRAFFSNLEAVGSNPEVFSKKIFLDIAILRPFMSFTHFSAQVTSITSMGVLKVMRKLKFEQGVTPAFLVLERGDVRKLL